MRTSVAFATACGLALSGAIKLLPSVRSGRSPKRPKNLVWCEERGQSVPAAANRRLYGLIQSGTSRGQELARYYFAPRPRLSPGERG